MYVAGDCDLATRDECTQSCINKGDMIPVLASICMGVNCPCRHVCQVINVHDKVNKKMMIHDKSNTAQLYRKPVFSFISHSENQ